MSKFSGKLVTGSVSSPPCPSTPMGSAPCGPIKLVHFSIVNTSGATATVNIYIQPNAQTQISICPLNLQLAAGESYIDFNYELDPSEYITLTSTESVDYYFQFEP